MILFSHPTGNAFARQAAVALAEANVLGEYWTCVSWDPEAWINRAIPTKLRQELGRRALPKVVRPYARYVPWREIGRMFSRGVHIPWLTTRESGPWSIDGIFRDLDRKVAGRIGAHPGLTAVYAPEDGAAASFEAAERHELRRIYDLPIGYWRAAQAIYAEEAEREPEWASTMPGLLDSAEKLARKDRELELAEDVVVASSFTHRTLGLAPPGDRRVHVVPYGAPPAQIAPLSVPAGRKLRVMFAGSLGQRKGLADLLKAVATVQSGVELTLLGHKSSEACAPLNEAVRRHRWIPTLPNDQVLREMRTQDVLVFPSLFEGFGLVILEAMSQGTPVITTAHTAGPDLITDGVDGFIIPIRSPQSIAQKLDLLIRDKELLSAMKMAACRAAAKHSWLNYRRALCTTLLPELPASFPQKCPP